MTPADLHLDAACPTCPPVSGARGKIRMVDFASGLWSCHWPWGSIRMHQFSELAPVPAPDPARYPHRCPHCGAAAYVGAVPAAVDCSRRCR